MVVHTQDTVQLVRTIAQVCSSIQPSIRLGATLNDMVIILVLNVCDANYPGLCVVRSSSSQILGKASEFRQKTRVIQTVEVPAWKKPGFRRGDNVTILWVASSPLPSRFRLTQYICRSLRYSKSDPSVAPRYIVPYYPLDNLLNSPEATKESSKGNFTILIFAERQKVPHWILMF